MFESHDYYSLSTEFEGCVHLLPKSGAGQHNSKSAPVVFGSRDVARRFCEFVGKDFRIHKMCPHTLQQHVAFADDRLLLIVDVHSNSIESATLTWEDFLQIAPQAQPSAIQAIADIAGN